MIRAIVRLYSTSRNFGKKFWKKILEKNFGEFCNVKFAYIPLESLAAEVLMDPIGAAMAIALTVSLFKRTIRIIL